MNVYFQNSKGEMRVIGEAKTEDQVYDIIQAFLDDHDYKSYYMRVWYDEDEGKTWIDVGSWTEFFACDGNLMEE